MKKLIELLKQFDIKRGRQYPEYKIEKGIIYYVYHNPLEGDEYIDCTLNIISKQFGFIQWLVDNNKIDTQNLITYINGTSLTFNKVPSTDCAGIEKTWNKFYTECLLMLLAISDTPIEDLISYLK